MENFKLDLAKLTPVAEKDRVQGNWYVVADGMGEHGRISQWYSGNLAMSHVRGYEGASWAFWFAIPPNLPGFPVQELPERINLSRREWALAYSDELIMISRKPKLPSLSIPEQTESERRDWLQAELDKLGK
jgi:hypothetical protein